MECAKEVIRHVSQDELKKLVRKEKNRHVLERLLFIRQLYIGDSVETACDRICISIQTGYNWLEAWNAKGYQGLAPDFGGGRPSKLTKDEKEQLNKKLSEGNWLTSQVRALIKHDFGVSYSISQVVRILRAFKMNYAKPYPSDYRKPGNAETLLKQAIALAISDTPSGSVVGFMDEASPQTTDNRQRVWSFGKPKSVKNTTKYRANTFGFYPVNGKEVVEFMENSRTPSVCAFLRKIKDKNPGRHILAFLDNAPQHIAKRTKEFAASIGITLVFLPKYSPDLNPIEFIWKSVRRTMSQIFAKSEWSFKETIRTAFHRFAKKKSFMASWLDKFGPHVSKLL